MKASLKDNIIDVLKIENKMLKIIFLNLSRLVSIKESDGKQQFNYKHGTLTKC